MKTTIYKLIWSTILTSLSAFSPSFADSIYDKTDSQTDVPTFPWADFQPVAQQATNSVAQAQMSRAGRSAIYQTSAPAPNRPKPKTSKRTNTNLSAFLPPTVTNNNMTDLNVVDTGEFEPKVDESSILDSSYEAARLAKERAEAAKGDTLPDGSIN